MKKVFLIFLFLISVTSFAQELNCKVTVNYEGLPVVNREILKDFGPAVESYINKTKYALGAWDGPRIECSMDIYFTSASEDNNYTAQVFIGSRRPIYKSSQESQMVSVLDNSWSFNYLRGQALYQNPNMFDAITSFIDFYAYLMIGFDNDSFQRLAGTPYFNKAADLCNLGASSKFNNGWARTTNNYNRRALLDDILSEKYRPFREAYFNYHYNGIDLYNIDINKAQMAIANLINTLEGIRVKSDLNSVFVRTFFDAKNGEIIDRMKNYPSKDIFNTLKRLDPSHIRKYDEAVGIK